jgi:hypothetical protein
LDNFSSLIVSMREFHRFYHAFLSPIIFSHQLFWSLVMKSSASVVAQTGWRSGT